MVLTFQALKSIRKKADWQWENLKLCIHSLFGNCHLDKNYAADVCMEPVIWIVDNFTKSLGPFFVVCVVLIMLAVILIAYTIGLPYYWNKNPGLAVFLIIFGNWLKWNTLFHYYMGVVTPPGYPPKGAMIQEAVSICRKCISPKPPRTHHCSVCNRCILKMDHHCPWLNNCVGHYNHRYFYMYIIFISLSTLFLMIFGYEIAYTEVWLQEGQSDELYGHPVRFTNSQFVPVPEWDNSTETELPVEPTPPPGARLRRQAILFMAFICSGAFIALTWLAVVHGKQIARGETSVEAHINKSELKRLSSRKTKNNSYHPHPINEIQINPYDYGTYDNWRIFLGISRNRSWLRVVFPSPHPPIGNGLVWQNVNHIRQSLQDKKIP